MKKLGWVLVAVCLGLFGTGNLLASGSPETAVQADYLVGPGDLLDIGVWKDEALTRKVVVLPDGKIAFPLVGQIQAGGRSVADITKELEQKLSRFVPNVELSVAVNQVKSMIIYVIGRVTKPGHFELTTDVNVLQALAMAGGLNPFAKRGDIKIFRETGGATKVFTFDYDSASSGEDISKNIKLKRGDLIVVP
jgi:polysaccharide export outer membrane protein